MQVLKGTTEQPEIAVVERKDLRTFKKQFPEAVFLDQDEFALLVQLGKPLKESSIVIQVKKYFPFSRIEKIWTK